MKAFKQRLLEHCKFLISRKIELLSFAMEEIRGSMENETKSSAGDKHETARAKMQAEHEKLNWQLDEMKGQMDLLDKVDLTRDCTRVLNENLVLTDKGLFFIAVPLGKVDFEEKIIYVISATSPLGKALIGLKPHEKTKVNNFEYTILEIH